jgi:hypothetical protein
MRESRAGIDRHRLMIAAVVVRLERGVSELRGARVQLIAGGWRLGTA